MNINYGDMEQVGVFAIIFFIPFTFLDKNEIIKNLEGNPVNDYFELLHTVWHMYCSTQQKLVSFALALFSECSNMYTRTHTPRHTSPEQ